MNEKILLQSENREKENRTLDILVNLNSYLEIAASYVGNNDNNKELFHIGLLIDNMQKEVRELMEINGLLESE